MAALVGLGVLNFFILFTVLIHFKVEGKQSLISLDEDNWDQMLEGEWMVEFYAPWCPACKSLQPKWKEFSDWSSDLGIKVGQVDVTTSPGLSGRFMVTVLPTIFHVLKGEFRQYKGGHDKEDLISFVEDKKWENIDPVPSWKSPGSIQMSVLSYFFKLATFLRSIHNQLLEEYGLPTWGSYLIFAVATIFIGALLGLVLVCIIDCIYTPKSSSSMKTLKEEVEVLIQYFHQADEVDDLVDEAGEGLGEKGEDTSDVENSQEEDKNLSGGSGGESSPNVRKRRPRKAD
ncbi:UNVERIFIED_CONTAM: hypothetical protein PYX00_006261 [Menopon gallinae]|uniref:Thioredoxin-related transmembrane protein 1 n=1 Tax=Menopon gallinae TaxID=328185 RepID=A0AAW2HUQ8_9NEOP